MRFLPLLALFALVAASAAPAAAQQRLQPTVGSTVVPRTHAGEVQRIRAATPQVRQVGRLAARYKNLRANRTRSLQTRTLRLRSAGTARPVLRTVRTGSTRLVRLNGSHFRVRR